MNEKQLQDQITTLETILANVLERLQTIEDYPAFKTFPREDKDDGTRVIEEPDLTPSGEILSVSIPALPAQGNRDGKVLQLKGDVMVWAEADKSL